MNNHEPSIVINGKQLTEGQAMTVRCAITSFHMGLDADGLGDDKLGVAIKNGYIKNISELYAIMGLL